MAPQPIRRLDYAAGMVRAVARHLIPENGAHDLVNGLLDDDGSAYRRGGSEYLTTSDFGAAGLLFLWTGHLAVGERTVVANGSDFGVLNDAGTAIVNLGGAGLSRPKAAVSIGGVLVIGGGVIYGGSKKTADYSTGTVSVTNGSAVVTGAGTAFSANVDAGMLFKKSGDSRYYVVESVDSNTQLTLTELYEGTTSAGSGYALTRLGTAPVVADIYAVVADRLVACVGNKASVSRGRTASEDAFSGQLQWQTFDTNEYHEVPDGVDIVGAIGLRDQLLLFSTQGLYSVTNMAFDLVDPFGNPQRQVQVLSRDIILWEHEGLTMYGAAVLAPCVDGVRLIDGVAAPVDVALSVKPLVHEYARAGHRLGLAAVYREHLLVPVLTAANGVVDQLVCRLDRPVRTRLGVIFPWTRVEGSAAEVSCYAVRVGDAARSPALYAAGLQATSRILELSSFFEPAAAVKNDHDGTTHEFWVDTRDEGDGTWEGFWKWLRVRYELVDAGTDDPLLSAYYSIGVVEAGTALWDTAEWGTDVWAAASDVTFKQMEGQAPEDDGRTPFTWRPMVGARFIRFRIGSRHPAADLRLRSHEVFVRPTEKP